MTFVPFKKVNNKNIIIIIINRGLIMTKKIYEYGSWNTLSSKILDNDKSYFIHIPQVLILNERYKEIVLPWCYLLFKRGIDNTIMCSLNYLTEQCGYAYSHKKNTDAGNMAERIKQLIDLDFISVDERFLVHEDNLSFIHKCIFVI